MTAKRLVIRLKSPDSLHANMLGSGHFVAVMGFLGNRGAMPALAALTLRYVHCHVLGVVFTNQDDDCIAVDCADATNDIAGSVGVPPRFRVKYGIVVDPAQSLVPERAQ